jgi:hypothetical protein
MLTLTLGILVVTETARPPSVSDTVPLAAQALARIGSQTFSTRVQTFDFRECQHGSSEVPASLFDYEPSDLPVAHCEPEMEIDLSSGKVPLQVVGDVVSVVAKLGRSCHLDRVGELARRAG